MTNQYLIGIGAALIILLGVEQYGEHRVQVEWDKDKAVREALAVKAEKDNKENIYALNKQHQKDIKTATGKAGRDAVADYLKSIGVLSNGLTVRSEGSGKAESPKLPNERSDTESSTRSSIERFGLECAKGAVMNMDWREWAIHEGLEVE